MTQTFDPDWDQISADIVTASGAVTIDQQFNGDWTLTGGTVTSTIGPNVDFVQAYDANWDQIANSGHLYVYAQAGLESFAAPTGIAVTYVIQPGDINGDAFSGFVTAAMNPGSHDVLEFEGYGPGAGLTQIDASHWQISAPGRASEVFTLAGMLNPSAGDVVFE